jgi:hypothetical protein
MSVKTNTSIGLLKPEKTFEQQNQSRSTNQTQEKKNMKKKIIAILAASLVGCSSAPKSGIENAGSEFVIGRIDELSSRPSWVNESEPFKIENGKVTSLGMTTVNADDANMAAVYRISDSNAKSAISHAIEQRLDYVFQQGDEGVTLGANQVHFIATEGSKLTSNSLRATKHFWEKLRIVQENGQPVIRYRVFSLVEMPEPDFKSAIIDAIKRSQGKISVSAEFTKKLDHQWQKFVDADQPTGAQSQHSTKTSNENE